MSDETVEPQETIAEERPSGLPDNFKSTEDLARSYKEAQAALTRTNQELAEVRGQVGEILAAQQQQYQQAEYSTQQNQLIEQWETGDPQTQLATMAWLASEAAKQALEGYQPPQTQDPNRGAILADIADRRMRDKYSDWNEISDDVRVLVQEDPQLLQVDATSNPDQLVKGLERAYKIVKADRVLSQTEQYAQANEAENRQNRQQAQTISGASQRPAVTDPATEYWDSVKSTPQTGYRPVGRL